MNFPKSFDVILQDIFVRNASKNGEVIDYYLTTDLGIVQLLSRALRFSYKMYTAQAGRTGFFVGDIVMEELWMHHMTYPIGTFGITFATEKPNYVSSSLAFLKPFSLNTWVGLLFSILLVACTLRLAYRGKIPLPYALFRVSASFLTQHRDWRPKSVAQKLVVLTWGVGITFLTLSYGSILLSFLSVPVRDKGINDFNELSEAIFQGKATAVMFRGGFGIDIFIESGDEKMKVIGEHLKNKNKLEPTLDGNFLQVIKPNVAVINARGMLDLLFGAERHFISEDSLSLKFLAIYVDEDWGMWTAKCNEVIHWIWAAGLNKKMVEDSKFKETLRMSTIHRNSFSSVEVAIRPLGLSSLSGAFYLLLIGHLLGIICFLSELYTFVTM